MRGAAKCYTMTSGWALETDGANQVPMAIESGQTRLFQMLLAAEPDTVGVEVSVVLTGETAGQADEVWLQINHVPVGLACSVELIAESANAARRAVFHVPAKALRDGRNTLLLRNEGKTLTVLSMDVRVHP